MALPGFGIVQAPALEEGLTEVALKPTVPPNGWLRMRAASHPGNGIRLKRSQHFPDYAGEPLPFHFLQTWLRATEL